MALPAAEGRTDHEADLLAPAGAHELQMYAHVKAYLVADYAPYGDVTQKWYQDGERVLLDGFPGCDATPVEHDGRWWLFCGNQDDRGTERLYLFMADALTGPWRPHPGNPVKADAGSARPGGLPFVHEGVLYRPAQDCSRTYGGALVLNRVTDRKSVV